MNQIKRYYFLFFNSPEVKNPEIKVCTILALYGGSGEEFATDIDFGLSSVAETLVFSKLLGLSDQICPFISITIFLYVTLSWLLILTRTQFVELLVHLVKQDNLIPRFSFHYICKDLSQNKLIDTRVRELRCKPPLSHHIPATPSCSWAYSVPQKNQTCY